MSDRTTLALFCLAVPCACVLLVAYLERRHK